MGKHAVDPDFVVDPRAYAWVRDMYAQEWSLYDCQVELTKLLQQVERSPNESNPTDGSNG